METIDYIVREMREVKDAVAITYDRHFISIGELADRIEAAAKELTNEVARLRAALKEREVK